MRKQTLILAAVTSSLTLMFLIPVIGQNGLDEATKAALRQASTRRTNIAGLPADVKLKRAKALAKAQTVPTQLLANGTLNAPVTFTMSNGKEVASPKFIGQLTFLGDITGVSPYDETVSLGKYVPGASHSPVVFFQFLPKEPGIFVMDVAMDSPFKSTGNAKLSIDGATSDAQLLGDDGHVLFLLNIKQVSGGAADYWLHCDHEWTFKSLEVSRFK